MNFRNEFITWYFNEFRQDPLYLAMAAIVEDSPWHRERDVGTHSDMVVGQYLARTGHQDTWYSYTKGNGHSFLLGAFACAFHDVGKPPSMQIKYKPERGEYRAFNGHEPVSARMWEDWAVRNWDMLKTRFGMVPMDIYITGWMIENHLPWGLKKEDKLNNLALTVARNEIFNVFPHVLMADTTGRISDDHTDKINKSKVWVDQFHSRVRNVGMQFLNGDDSLLTHDDLLMVMPVAPSGAGKSTLYHAFYQKLQHFSLDEERLAFGAANLELPDDLDAPTRYSACWGYCSDHKADFNRHWQARFVEIVKGKSSVFVDNTNLSRKSRRFFLDQADRRGYKTKAVLLPITEREAHARQSSRPDKTVPHGSVNQQYNALQLPWYGEFDFIEVLMP